MRLRLKYCLFLFIYIHAFAVGGKSQDNDFITVGNIIVSGNKKTKPSIILREIPFKTGDKYPLRELVKNFTTARRQLLNTRLFTEVVVAAKEITGSNVDVIIEVKERNYLFPVPYFRPVDRNLNQWLVEKHANLNRVNYGMKLYYNNATGNNDKLRVGVTTGYTRQFSFSYDRLYLDRNMKWGAGISFGTGKNHELNYNTINDKQVFLKVDNDYVRRFTSGSVQVTYRPAIKTKHTIGAGMSSESISDTILSLNPSYFKSGRKSIVFPFIFYTLSYYDLNYIPYPTKGYASEMGVSKTGINNQLNIWQLHMKGLGCWPLNEKTFLSAMVYAGIKLPFKQPYYNQRLFGYGDVYLQGFEYFVVDGVAGALLKQSLNRRLINTQIRLRPAKKDRPNWKIPFSVYGKIFGNTGYAYHPDPGANSLSNKMLYSGGIGIDIITFYDITFKLEWSFNSLGQNGLFLHRKTIF